MALRFPVLFVGFVSFSSLRPPSSSLLSPITLLPCVVVLLIGVPFLRGLSFSDHRFLFRPVVLYFMFYVLCFTFYVLLLYPFGLDFYGVCLCWIMDLDCLCLVLRLWQRCSALVTLRSTSILAALFLPHASSPSSSPPVSLLLCLLPSSSSPSFLSLLCLLPLSSLRRSPFVISSSFSLRRFAFVASPSCLLRRLHLGISTLASAFILQPLSGSSSVVLVVCWALAWTLDRRKGVLSQMQVLALHVGRGILAVTFRP